MTIAFDTPGALPYEMVTRLGKGTAVKILDGSIICDTRMPSFMKATATKHAIPYQLEILPAGGTDTGAIQRQGNKGSIAGAISIPTRHIHSVIEMAHKEDVRNCICLLYTSDAADERSSVDLGGRRILKKKKEHTHTDITVTTYTYVYIRIYMRKQVRHYFTISV